MSARVSSPGLMEEHSGGHEVLGSNPAWNTTNLGACTLCVQGVAVVVKLHLMVGLPPTDSNSLHTQDMGVGDLSESAGVRVQDFHSPHLDALFCGHTEVGVCILYDLQWSP